MSSTTQRCASTRRGGELRVLVWRYASAVGKGQPYVEAMALRISVNVEATVR
jgi:hypothetical protein